MLVASLEHFYGQVLTDGIHTLKETAPELDDASGAFAQLIAHNVWLAAGF